MTKTYILNFLLLQLYVGATNASVFIIECFAVIFTFRQTKQLSNTWRRKFVQMYNQFYTLMHIIIYAVFFVFWIFEFLNFWIFEFLNFWISEFSKFFVLLFCSIDCKKESDPYDLSTITNLFAIHKYFLKEWMNYI